MKWVFPVLWIGGFGAGTCALWLGASHGRGGQAPPDWLKWQFLALWLAGTVFNIWFCGRIKRVAVDDEALYVSNYWSEVRIALAEVSHFTQSFLSRPATVTIHLRRLSAAGERVVFIPKSRWVLFGIHPVIIELQALCDQASVQGEASQPKTTYRTSGTRSMRVLQAICVLFCLLSIASAVTGIQSIRATSDGVAISRYSGFGRCYAIAAALVFAAAFYGIHRRSLVAWKLGWMVLAALTLGIVISALIDALKQPTPGHWMASCFMVIGGSAVAVFWGIWRKRQRGYFG